MNLDEVSIRLKEKESRKLIIKMEIMNIYAQYD